jgi:glycosyltransferase involved in cell wall biosynthesis
LRVHFWRADTGGVLGGHLVQIAETLAALRRLDVEATSSTCDEPLPGGVDLVHAVGASAEALREARRLGVPIAYSTIYHSRSEREDHGKGTGGPISTLGAYVGEFRLHAALALSAAHGRVLAKCVSIMSEEMSYLRNLEAADLLLPNSPGEARSLREELRVTAPLWLVPNAVDGPRFSSVSSNTDRPIDVLYVGRFEPAKNQLRLIRALRRSDLRVVLIGPAHPHHPRYRAQCQRTAAGTKIEVRESLSHDELPELYGSAKLHVLPSWFETTGLVSLEAAAAGCRVVTTSRGHARDYFGDLAWYCDPSSEENIRTAIEIALSEPVPSGLKDHILRNFTWEATAHATFRAYSALLDGSYAEGNSEWPSPPSGLERGTPPIN